MGEAGCVRFGDFTLDVARRRLHRGDQEVALTPRAFDVLAALVEGRERTLEKDELLARVWPGTTVEEANLSQQIFLIRKALGDDSSHSRFIATIPRRGYRWIAPVDIAAGLHGAPPPASPPDRWLTPRRRWSVAALLALVLGGVAASYRPGGGESTDGSMPRIRSLAVLPLTTLSPGSDEEYFTEGVTEALIDELSKIGTLEVISRTSSSLYKDSTLSIPRIAQELGVDGVVEGALLRQGDRVRLSVRLVDARTDRGLWANTYDRDLQDVVRLTGAIGAAVAREIALALTPGEQARLASARPVSPEAYRMHLKGLHLLANQTRWFADALGYDNWAGARENLEGAIALDPGFAAAHVGLARFFTAAGSSGVMARGEAFARAELAARRAIELDPTQADAHVAIATIRLLWDWDWLAAGRAFEQALALNPSSTRAHTHYAGLFRALGELDKAVLEAQTALDLDPLNVPVRFNLAYELLFAGRFDEAAAHYRELLELDPRSVAAHWALGTIYELRARYEEAGTEMMTVLRLLGDDAAEEQFGRLLGAHGYVEARRWLDSRDVERELNQEQPDAWFLAYTYARLNDRDRAFEWLERAYQARDPGLLQIRVDWDFEGLRSDPRFAALVDRVGFPP